MSVCPVSPGLTTLPSRNTVRLEPCRATRREATCTPTSAPLSACRGRRIVFPVASSTAKTEAVAQATAANSPDFGAVSRDAPRRTGFALEVRSGDTSGTRSSWWPGGPVRPHERAKFFVIDEGVGTNDGEARKRLRPTAQEEIRSFRFSRLGP